MTQYKSEDLVYLILPQTSLLKPISMKFRVIHLGELVIYKILDKFQHILIGIEGKTLNGILPLVGLSKHFKNNKISC